MSDSEPSDVDEIREQKRKRLEQQAESANEPIHVESDDHLDDLVAENAVVLVDFYADWCGPCKMLAPTVETLAAETKATVAKVDVDELQSLAAQYDVQGVPTLYLFADGEAVEQLVGVQDENTLRDLITQHS